MIPFPSRNCLPCLFWLPLCWLIVNAPNGARAAEILQQAQQGQLGVDQLFKQMYEQAAADRSAAPLQAILDDKFTAVLVTIGPQQGQAIVTNSAGLAQYFGVVKDLIGDGTYTLAVHPDGPADYAGDMAVAHGSLENGIVTGHGGEFHLNILWTAVFRRQPAGPWKLLRLQESLDPINNPIIEVMKHDLIVRGSFIAVVVGMIFGWLFRGLFLKKPAA